MVGLCWRSSSAGRIPTLISFTIFLLLLLLLFSPNDPHLLSWFAPKRVVSVDDFGAVGDGLADDTEAFRAAWTDACSRFLRPILKVPSGKSYLVGPINFGHPCQSRVTLIVSGTIIAPKEPRYWDGLNPRKWLYFHGLDDFVVKGGGTINGMGEKWWAKSCKVNATHPCGHAPTALTFHRCNNLSVRNLVILDSQQNHLAFTKCYGVDASHLTVIAHPNSPNTDGIHISESTRVVVKSSIIRTGDDCVSIVSNSSAVRIKNITCGPGHGISIGSLGKFNSYSQVHDIVIDEAFISNTENGLRIKTWQGGSGYAKDIKFQNVWMKNVSNPIIIDQFYCDSSVPCVNQTSSVKVEHVSFRGIRGTSATEEAIRFACSDNFPCERISLGDIYLYNEGGNTSAFCWNAFGFSTGTMYWTCWESSVAQDSNRGATHYPEANKEKPNRASGFVGDHLIAKMSKIMRKGLSMKNPILSSIDEDEVAVAPAADAGSRPHFQRVQSWESGRRRNLSSGSGKIAGCDSNDVNECAEAFIRRFRQQLQLQRRHSMGNFEKMMSMTEN